MLMEVLIMLVERFQIKFTQAERALLRKRSKKEGVTEADHLRMCMVADAVMCGDLDAVRILGDAMKRKLVDRLSVALKSEAAA
jgi:hypothetical protein